MADYKRSVAFYLLALVSRLLLIYSPLSDWLKNRIEFSTPLTAWNRVQEGLSLVKHGISPYSGDVVHESPLVLVAFLGLQEVSNWLSPLLFVACDLMVGLLLQKLAHLHCQMMLKDQKDRLGSYAKSVEPILIKECFLKDIPVLTSAIYLLNPHTVGSCVAQSTVVFTNLGVTTALLFSLRGNVLLSTLGVAVATYHSLYPVVLLAPICLILIKVTSGGVKLNRKDVLFVTKILTSFALWLLMLLVMSYHVFKSWNFLAATYGFILQVSDLTPNMGLFWYFFTEVFEHFRIFFLWVFQLNAFFYSIPLTIKLRDYPTFLACVLCSLMAIMKSYPALGDATLPFALLALWAHVFPYLRNTFLIICMLLWSSFLAPAFFQLWIYAGSANANFFFAITLAYSTSQILLISDVFFAFLRREYDLRHGIYPPVLADGGDTAAIVLR